jgi:cell division protein FtsN
VRRDSLRRDPQRRDSVRRPDAPPTLANARYTVQVAAYDTRVEADRLVARLAARGFPARVVGERTPPFRVRIGYYPSETHAETAARDLKAKGIDAFVTTTDNERSPSSRAPNGKAPE